MKTLPRTSWLLFAALAFGAALIVWRSDHSPPDLKLPIVLEESYALADGGSVQVVLAGADGNRIAVGVRGSLDLPREKFPVFIQRWYPAMKIPVYLPVGGEQELCLLSKLVAWDASVSPENPNRGILNEIIRRISSRQPEYRQYSC